MDNKNNIRGTARQVRKNIRCLNGFLAARQTMVLIAVIVPYLQDHVHLTFHELILTEVIFAATMVLAEVPSGWLADQWRRRSALILGSVLWIASLFLYWFGTNFWHIALGQFVIGIALSLQSGADSALLYDSLRTVRATKKFLALESKRHSYGLTALAGASLLAGVLYAQSYHLVFAVDLVSSILVLVFALMLWEPPREKTGDRHIGLRTMFQVIVQVCRKHQIIIWVLVFATGLQASSKLNIWVQQAYYRLLEIDIVWYGPLAAATFLSGAIAAHLTASFSRHLGVRNLLFCLTGSVFAGYVLLAAFPHFAILPCVIIAGASWGISKPVLTTIVNDQVGSAHRATMLSVLNLAPQLGFMLTADIVGRIIDWSSAAMGFGALAVLILITALISFPALSKRLPPARAVRL